MTATRSFVYQKNLNKDKEDVERGSDSGDVEVKRVDGAANKNKPMSSGHNHRRSGSNAPNTRWSMLKAGLLTPE